jgi:hypothetical protein
LMMGVIETSAYIYIYFFIEAFPAYRPPDNLFNILALRVTVRMAH